MDTRYINKTYFISADDEGDDAITKLIVGQQAYETQLKEIMANTTLDEDSKVTAIQTMKITYIIPELT